MINTLNNPDSISHLISMDPVNDTGIALGYSTMKGQGPWKGSWEETGKAYGKLAHLLKTKPEKMVRPCQEHTDLVLKVDEGMGGMGVMTSAPEPAADGLITNIPGMALCVITADCVPVALLDPEKKAAGLVHSGWKGTASIISAKALRKMKEEYGTDPADVIIWIGPHICGKCYEVGGELIPPFRKEFPEEEITQFFLAKTNGKYLLNLDKAIRFALIREGIREANIHSAHRCTYENEDLNSYRRDTHQGKSFTGRNLSAISLL